MQQSEEFIKKLDMHSHEMQKAMQVGAMVLLDQSGNNKLINLTQFGMVDETVSRKIDTAFTWAALVEVNGVQFIVEFSEQIFQPLEKVIGENIRYNWLDVGQRMLVVEALIGHLNNNKVIARPDDPAQPPKVLMEADALNTMLDNISILDVFSLNEETQLFNEKCEALKLAHPSEWVVQYPVDPSSQTAVSITKLRVHMNQMLWKSLVQWANVRKKNPEKSNLLQPAEISVTILKPFQYVNVAELNSLRCGDAVGLKAEHQRQFWLRLNKSPHLIQVNISEEGEFTTTYLKKIPKENAKEVCLSFGTTTSIRAYDWLSDVNQSLKTLVHSFVKTLQNGEGGFYVDFYKASRGQVIEYKGHRILQLRDHRELVK